MIIWALLISLLLFAVVTTVINPRWIFLWIWLIPSTAINNKWQELGIPLNAGYDDLYVVFAFVLVLIAGYRGQLPARSRATKWMLYYLGAVVLGNFTGWVIYRDSLGGLGPTMLREVLKMTTFVFAAWTVFRLIRTREDYVRAWRGMYLGILAGAVLAMYTYYNPQLQEWFGSPSGIEKVQMGLVTGYYRMAGAFMEPNAAAQMFMIAIGTLPLVFSYSKVPMRLVCLAGAGVLVVSAMLTGSRTVVLIGLAMAASVYRFKGYRVHVIVFFTLALAGLVLFPEFTGLTVKRLNTVAAGAATRTGIWMRYLESLDARTLLLGRGQWPTWRVAVGDFQGHNAFIDMLCFYGIWGLIFGTALFVWTGTKLRALKRIPTPLARGSFTAGLLVFLALIVSAMVADAMTPQATRLKVMFCLMVMLERGQQLALAELGQLQLDEDWAAEEDWADAYEPLEALNYGNGGTA